MAEEKRKMISIEEVDQAIAERVHSGRDSEEFRKSYSALIGIGVRPSIAVYKLTANSGEFNFMQVIEALGEVDPKFLMELCAILRESNSAISKVLSHKPLTEEIAKDCEKAMAWLEEVGMDSDGFRSELLKAQNTGNPNQSTVIFPFEANWLHRIRGNGKFIPDIERKVAAWVSSPNAPHWSQEQRKNVLSLLHFLAQKLDKITQIRDLNELRKELGELMGTLEYLKGQREVMMLGGPRNEVYGFNLKDFPPGIEMSLHMGTIAYHVVQTLFQIGEQTYSLKNKNELDVLNKRDRDGVITQISTQERKGGSTEISIWLSHLINFLDRSLGSKERSRVKERKMEVLQDDEFSLERVKTLQSWLNQTGLGRPELRAAIQHYIHHPEDRDRRVIFPITRIERGKRLNPEDNLHTLGAVWAFNSDSRDWTPEEAAGVAVITGYMTVILKRIAEAKDLATQREVGSDLFNLTNWLNKVKGIRTRGMEYNQERVVRLANPFPDIVPENLILDGDSSILAYHFATSLFRITGFTDKNIFDPNHRNQAIDCLLKRTPAITDGERKWLVYVLKPIMDQKLIACVLDIQIIFDFASGHFSDKRRDSKSNSVKDRIRKNNELREACSEPDYVAGQLQGYASVTGIKPVRSLYIGRPAAHKIEPPEKEQSGALICQGYIEVMVREKAYKIEWKMGADGRLVFIVGEKSFGWGTFGNKKPAIKNFFLSIENAILQELKKALVRNRAESEPKIRPHSIETRNTGEKDEISPHGLNETNIRITGRRERARQELLREVTEDERKGSKAALSRQIAKYGELLARMGEYKTLEEAGITDRDLEGLELYVLEDMMEGEKKLGQIHVIGETRELLAATLQQPEWKEKIFLCQSRAHIRRAGYRASKVREGEVTTYRSQKIPTEASEIRRKSVQKHFKIGDLDLEVRQESNLNVSLGPELQQPEIEWIVIGSAEAVRRHRTNFFPSNYKAGKQNDGSLLIRITEVIDLDQAKVKANLPKGVVSADLIMIQDKSGKEVWTLSLTAEAEQLPQFHEGEYVSLVEAEKRYKQ